MNTLTTFLLIANGTTLFVIILQAATIKKLYKTIGDSSDLLQRYKVLSAFYKKRACKNSLRNI